MRIHVLGLNETRLSDTIPDSFVGIDSYTLYRRDRDRQGGGVGVYVKQTIPSQRRCELEQDDLEVCCIEIKPEKARKTLLACVYRPPTSGPDWRNSAESLVHKLSQTAEKENADVAIMGDFNSDLLNSTQAMSSVEFLMGLYQLDPVIREPTRITEITESCIDNIFVSNPDRYKSSASVAWGPSDHNLILTCAKAGGEAGGSRRCEYRSYKQYTQQSFIDSLKSVRWDTVLDCFDVTDTWNAFKDVFLSVADEHAPLRMKTVRENSHTAPWLTDRAKNMMGRRDAARRKAIKTKDVKDWEIYRSLRNQTTSMIRKEKKTHFAEAVSEAKGDQSLMWKIINAFTGKSKSKSQVQNLVRPDNTSTSNPSEMAQEFNDYFSTCASKLTDGMTAPQGNPLRHIPEPTRTFSFESVDESTVLNELQRLKTKKATGLDKIPSKLLKDSAPVIVKPLTHIFNLSLATGQVPTDWKEAQISPIHKSGNRANVANYRPVSVLSVMSKVMEKLVGNQVTRFLTRHDLLTTHQSGFRRHHSTATAVQKIVEDIKSAFNCSKVTVALFLDLRKAFDTVNHDILLGKLKKLGFDNDVTNWFESYLADRFQTTHLQGQYSSKSRVNCGVPQGSVLGPLLFCLYVNDLPNVIRNCSIQMYADDTVLYFSASTVKDCEEAVSSDVRRVVDWLNENKLLLHPDKTKSMLFGLPQKLRYAGGTVNITDGVNVYEQVSSFTYLGITLDPSLRWMAHVAKITAKILGGLGAMGRARAFVSTDILQTMYQTLLLSHLDYCATAWLPSLVLSNKTLVLQLGRLINRAARLITGHLLKDHVPVEVLLAEAGLEPLTKRVETISLATVFKAVRGKAPVYMTDLFRWKSPPMLRARTRTEAKLIRDYDPHLLHCPSARVASYRSSMQHYGAQLWNTLPLKQRAAVTYKDFKNGNPSKN
ncbi:Hypp973 [Branchiostoma lanceolatum]|uniref:Hypp973 protein n=1 Tax=Branchiostoma lanceolatum TaxID=7740 RepID=A0A8K0EL16_BRALA|nr:Hypp973 [Branchiostoma lanceolatum]